MHFDFMNRYLEEEFEEVAVLKQSGRGIVTKLRHRESHRLYICKRFLGSAEPYQQLLTVYCSSLPRIYDAAEKDGHALVLEEFITGDTLLSLLEGGALAEAEVISICRQLGAALCTLHGLGLVHRDIKPENILLQGENVWLIDFDAARTYSAEKESDTQVLGTIGYASPEQFGFSQTDARTDIYSMGVLINEMLTLEHPSVKLAPGRWGKIVRRCTMMNPACRYQNIRDFLEALPFRGKWFLDHPENQSPEKTAAAASEQISPDKPRDQEMRVCMRCGRPLPAEAVFCPWCESSQNERHEVHPPGVSRRRIIKVLLLILTCILAISIIHWRRTSPRDYRGDVSVDYRLNGKKCTVVLSFNQELSPREAKMVVHQDELPEGNQSVVFSRLFLQTDTGDDLGKKFIESIEAFQVTTAPRDGAAPMQIWESILQRDENGQVGMAQVVYGPENGTNDICWDLTMKNGDTIHLEHTMTCRLIPKLEIHCEDTPLNTVEEIKAAIEKAMESGNPKAVPVVYLPPVEYEGELILDQCTAKLTGSTEGEKRTTFTGTLTIKTRSPILTEINNISFEGHGGIGLAAEEGVIVTDCSFRGYDIAADARDGSWIILESCRFEGNGTGFRFASRHATCSSFLYCDLRFTGNNVGVEICRVPGNTPLELADCVFENNGTDVVDPGGLVSGY